MYEPELKPKHALLVWRMLFEPNMDAIGTEVKADVRRPLVEAGLLASHPERNPNTGRQVQRFRLTDRAWSWAEENLDAKLNQAPSAGPLLQQVLTRVQAMLRRYDIPLAEFALATEDRETGDGAPDRTTQVRSAYLELTGGRLNESLPLTHLRDSLPELAREELDQTLLELFRAGACVLFPEDNTRQLTQSMEQAALSMSGERKHYVKLER